jgi:pimeloyl-ACP methyl ester carboxylesterase
MAMQTTTVEIGGHRTRLVDDGGETPAVVVLHGWGGRIESMAPVMSCLRSRFRVVALDLPGFGESPPPPGAWGTADYAAYVRDLLTHVGVGRAHFVGHSFGAKTALYLAAVHPALVDKLVLVASPGIRTPASATARAKRLASRGARAAGKLGSPGRKVRDAVYARIGSRDYRDAGPLRPVLVTVVNEDLAPLLPRIQASTLLVWGAGDDAVPVSHAHTMERLIPDAGLVLFEEAGHFAYLDEPRRFCRVVRHFLGAPVEG